MTIQEIIEGCELGGCSLEQRLAVVSFSSLPKCQEEEQLIVTELERRPAPAQPASDRNSLDAMLTPAS